MEFYPAGGRRRTYTRLSVPAVFVAIQVLCTFAESSLQILLEILLESLLESLLERLLESMMEGLLERASGREE
jgi:hypothetical protein